MRFRGRRWWGLGGRELFGSAEMRKSRSLAALRMTILKSVRPAERRNCGSAAGLRDLREPAGVLLRVYGAGVGDPETGQVYGPAFPLISIRDNVRAQALLLDSLGIDRLRLAIGGSIGGMQALDWAILFPERVKRAVVIAVAPLSAMGLALNHLQRQAICGDPEWLGGNYLRQPRRGLAQARQIAMLSYKSPQLFAERFGRNPNRNGEDPWALNDHGGGLGGDCERFDVAGFLDYQGERFLERFDANAYLAICKNHGYVGSGARLPLGTRGISAD
jgi:homoserine O-acetyltransferase